MKGNSYSKGTKTKFTTIYNQMRRSDDFKSVNIYSHSVLYIKYIRFGNRYKLQFRKNGMYWLVKGEYNQLIDQGVISKINITRLRKF